MTTDSDYETACSAIDDVLAAAVGQEGVDGASDFEDGDGLISFVNLASSFITDAPEFKTARDLCDKTSNFFGTLLPAVFTAMTRATNPVPPPPGYAKPATKWDPAVIEYVRELLQKSGGLTNFKLTEETFSRSMILADFSVDFLKTIFDAAVIPEKVVADVTAFLQGVGQSLRTSWDTQSKTFQTQVLSQCHEAIGIGDGKMYYYPKVKYVQIAVTSSQSEFTSPCVSTRSITFNFTYNYWVTGFAAQAIQQGSGEWQKFSDFLNKAQAKNYQDAANTVDSILDGVTSEPAAGEDSAVFSQHPTVAAR